MHRPFLATLLVFDIQHDPSYDMPGHIADEQYLPRLVGVHLIWPIRGPNNGVNLRGQGMTSPTVLVVKDDPAMLEVVSVILQDEGYRVQQAAHGKAALPVHCLSAGRYLTLT
jgi:hypothetical protein